MMTLFLWALALFGLAVIGCWAYRRGAPVFKRICEQVAAFEEWLEAQAGYGSPATNGTGPVRSVYRPGRTPASQAVTTHMPPDTIYRSQPSRKPPDDSSSLVGMALVNPANQKNYSFVPECGLTLVGRGLHCSMVLSDASVSKEHAVIFVEGTTWKIRDCSRNGTFVNGTRIEVENLKLGDRIRFAPSGPTLVVRRLNGERDPSPLNPPLQSDETLGDDGEQAGSGR